jgi:hypothetical protein
LAPHRPPFIIRTCPRGARASRPYGWIGLLAVVVLVVGGWLLVRQMAADAKLQDCVMSGRKNCAPVDRQ